MAVFKNVSGGPVDIPLYDLHIPKDGTFEVPDEVAASLADNPHFAKSRTMSPDTTITPDAADDVSPAPTAPTN